VQIYEKILNPQNIFSKKILKTGYNSYSLSLNILLPFLRERGLKRGFSLPSGELAKKERAEA
jgi:hypothetical protein